MIWLAANNYVLSCCKKGKIIYGVRKKYFNRAIRVERSFLFLKGRFSLEMPSNFSMQWKASVQPTTAQCTWPRSSHSQALSLSQPKNWAFRFSFSGWTNSPLKEIHGVFQSASQSASFPQPPDWKPLSMSRWFMMSINPPQYFSAEFSPLKWNLKQYKIIGWKPVKIRHGGQPGSVYPRVRHNCIDIAVCSGREAENCSLATPGRPVFIHSSYITK